MTNAMTLSRRGFIFSAICLAACNRGASVIEVAGSTMGTTYNVVALDNGVYATKDDLQNAIDASLELVNAQMSNWDSGSEISRLNANASTNFQSVSPELASVLNAAQEIYTQSEGYFDITLGSVIEAWGFGSSSQGLAVPSDGRIAKAMGSANMTVKDRAVRKHSPDTEMYLSSIAKGYGVDHVAKAVADLGFKDFMVEIGGDLYVSGMNPDGAAWKIGIESPDPIAQNVFKVAKLSDLGMATSGDYRNYFEDNGQRYSHIIDPINGRPVAHGTTSVTVLAESAMVADAWATALLAMGTSRGLDVANNLQIAALFIDRDQGNAQVEYKAKLSKKFEALQV